VALFGSQFDHLFLGAVIVPDDECRFEANANGSCTRFMCLILWPQLIVSLDHLREGHGQIGRFVEDVLEALNQSDLRQLDSG